jgi:hypothetical protein
MKIGVPKIILGAAGIHIIMILTVVYVDFHN